MDDRLILHTVHTDDGATEIYFGRTYDDQIITYEGSILFHADGSFTYKLWTTHDEPVVVSVKGNRVVIINGEDQAPQGELAPEALFDSERLDEITKALGVTS